MLTTEPTPLALAQAYAPAKLPFGQPHPDSVVETASLAAVEPPDITYQLTVSCEGFPCKRLPSSHLRLLRGSEVLGAFHLNPAAACLPHAIAPAYTAASPPAALQAHDQLLSCLSSQPLYRNILIGMPCSARPLCRRTTSC